MTARRLLPLAALLFTLVIALSGALSPADARPLFGVPIPPGISGTGQPEQPGSNPAPNHLTHPCGGMYAEPPFFGVSPLSITHVAGFCTDNVYASPYGDIGVWQANGHDYVVLAGFGLRMFYLFNVDDPYNPALLKTQPFPTGGTAGLSAFPFRQGSNYYVSATMRGSGTGCGFFVYNVNDPANPSLVGRKTGADWCTVHEHFVSTDTNGNADYAWLAMSGEGGSGYKIVVMDLRSLPTMTETGRYQRSDSNGGTIFIHDSNVVGNRAYLAHWEGGLIIHDKETLAHNTNPAPLNPINSIRPSGFAVHHTVPSTDGRFVFIEDEFENISNLEKIKIYNITDIANPVYAGGIVGSGTAATNRAHNMRIKNLSPGHDLLLVGWYQAGIRGFEVDTTGATPVLTETIRHQLRQSTNGDFGNVWGVDYLPCTVRGQARTCLYGGDMKYGLVVDVVGEDPSLDPYAPESQITSPTNGQSINACSYTIQGVAHDYYSGVTQVEVSTDNGGTWHLAQGTTSWTYQWAIATDGNYSLLVRATDAAGNLQTPPTPVNVSVAGGCGEVTTTPQASPTNTTSIMPPTSTSTVVPSSTATNTSASPTTTVHADTPVPSSTSTPTIYPTSTIGPPCGVLQGSGGHSSTCESATTYRYNFSFYSESGCPDTMTGNATLTFLVAPDENGPWTTFDQQGREVTLPRGYGGVTGTLTEANIPAQYNWYKIDFVAHFPNGANAYGETPPRYICALVTPTPIATALPCEISFTDVPPSNTFYPYVQCLACRSVLGGYNDGTFRPNNSITRGQIAKIVSNAVNSTVDPDTQIYEDVPPANTFYVFINRMSLMHVMSGYECGGTGEPCGSDNKPYFRPNASATRGQISKIVSNAAAYAEDHTTQTFEDVPTTHAFYIWIERLASRGIMGGYDCGGAGEPCGTPNRPYFRPYNSTTRGQTAKIVSNTFYPTCQPGLRR
ncbi:MAG TPA: S-layer homology domain-containing protein [Chloroflexia bacterium]|jgi:hypothetical protein